MSSGKKEESFMTSQEMIDRSSSWTLACDNALLNRLKKFSEDLSRNSQEILRECDNLKSSVTQLDYRVINVSNEFLMLSNTQFVENRVEEFNEEFSASVSSSNATSVQKTKAEKEAALISKMKQAIQLGMTACNDRRQQNESSLNQFTVKKPYLIGSPKFFSSKYCGLVDESSKEVHTYNEDPMDMDTVSLPESTDNVFNATPAFGKPEVKFTMPPPVVFPVKIPGTAISESDNNSLHTDDGFEHQGKTNHGRPVVPPSPTISDRSSSEIGGRGSASTNSRENVMPRCVTDELNKIYGSFAAPPPIDPDSDDDFRPNAGVGRLFDDDTDDIFDERDLFPSSQKKTDFFGRSNQPQLPATVYSVPPPVDAEPQSKPNSAASESPRISAVGPVPNTNDIPNAQRSNATMSNSDVPKRGPSFHTETATRTKLPPGAVSMFGNLPPPIFNNGTLQAAQTASLDPPSTSSVAEPDTQISSQSSFGSGLAPTTSSANIVAPSQDSTKSVNSGSSSVSSLPSHNVTAPGRTQNISQGSLSYSSTQVGAASSSKAAPTRSVPVSSLFADESSDEDIFQSSKKQITVNAKVSIPPSKAPPFVENKQVPPVVESKPVPVVSASASVVVKPPVNKKVYKPPPKKSIFDDSESEDDLFSSRPSKSPQVETKKATTPSNSLFGSESRKITTSVPAKVGTSKSLFGDDSSDSDTDLFGDKKKVVTHSSSLSRAPPKMEDIEPDLLPEKQDLFSEVKPQQSRKQSLEVGSNNNNNNEEEVVESLEPEEPNEHIKPLTHSNSTEAVKNKLSEPPPEDEVKSMQKAVPVKNSFFDDSESENSTEDMKDKLSEPPPQDEVKSVQKAMPVKKSVFDDEDETEKPTEAVKNKLSEPPPEDKVKSAQKAKPVKKSIFDDSESDDDLFSTKSQKPTPTIITTSKTEQKKPVPNAKVTKVKQSSLFGDDSDSDSDLFCSKPKHRQPEKLSTSLKDDTDNNGKTSVEDTEALVTNRTEVSKDSAEPSVPSSDDVDATVLKSKEQTSETTNKGDESESEPKSSKPVSSKISEKIKAMQSAKINHSEDDTPKPSSNKNMKGKVSVKNLALNLNINPLALKVGAKPPKLAGSTPTTPSTPEKEEIGAPSVEDASSSLNSPEKPTVEENVIKTSSSSTDITEESLTTTKSDSQPEQVTTQTIQISSGVDELVGILKARAKIQRKRRPPSRNFLKSLAAQSESETSQESTNPENADILESENAKEIDKENCESSTEKKDLSDKDNDDEVEVDESVTETI